MDGGARYHDYGFAPLGITAVADSLMAVRRAVFEEGTVGFSELLAALRDNFEGAEPLRQTAPRASEIRVQGTPGPTPCAGG